MLVVVNHNVNIFSDSLRHKSWGRMLTALVPREMSSDGTRVEHYSHFERKDTEVTLPSFRICPKMQWLLLVTYFSRVTSGSHVYQ